MTRGNCGTCEFRTRKARARAIWCWKGGSMAIADKIQGMATKAVNKMLGGRVEKWPVGKQAKAMRNLAYVHPKAMPIVRSNLLKDLPEEMRQLSKGGKTREEIKMHYWGCEAFVALWTMDLKMEEATFDELIRGAIECQ